MITDLLAAFVCTPLTWLGGVLPSTTFDPFANWALVNGHMADLNYYLPITELAIFTMSVSIVFPALAGVSLLVWLVAMIRGGSARA